jgi:hypothetical protein
MTVTANGSRTTLTDGHVRPDVHVRVRSPENTPPGGSDPETPSKSARARAIPRDWTKRQLSDGRDFVSLNVGELAESVTCGWAANQQPQPLSVTWRQVPPAKGEATGRANWCALTAAGVTRALFHTFGYLIVFATNTRIKAAVFGLITLTLAAIHLAADLAG